MQRLIAAPLPFLSCHLLLYPAVPHCIRMKSNLKELLLIIINFKIEKGGSKKRKKNEKTNTEEDGRSFMKERRRKEPQGIRRRGRGENVEEEESRNCRNKEEWKFK